MKSFSPVPVVMCALLLLAGDVSDAWKANAQPTSVAVSTEAAQDTAQNSSAAAVSGDWQVSWTNEDGDAKQGSMQFKQDGSSLSGTFQTPRGSAKLAGSLQGNQVSIDVKAGGRQISFTGTLDGDKMSGTTAQGKPWTATRQQGPKKHPIVSQPSIHSLGLGWLAIGKGTLSDSQLEKNHDPSQKRRLMEFADHV